MPLPALARATPETAAAPLVVERPDSEALLLALVLDGSVLAESLPAYQDRGAVLIPLGEIFRLLDLGISVDVARGLGSGFFIDESRRFALDALSERVIVEGQPKRFDAARIEVHRDDIYVDAALLSEWLPLHLHVDLHASIITVSPEEKLPLQLRIEREGKLEASRAATRADRSSVPLLALPYRLFEGPFLDQTLRYTSPRGGSGGGGIVEYSTYATGDLLFMEGSAFVSGSGREILDSRVSLSRKDPDGNLLGVLGAREVTVGDMFHPGIDLIALPQAGPGILISNFPLHLQSQFDRQSFRGDLPPGWEAELYRGTELVAYTQSRPNGLYEFLDVPLLFGLNVFRVELYGPQGQRRSETRRFNVGDTLTPKGRIHYRLAANQPGYRLFGGPEMVGQGRASFDLSAGLSRNLSGSLSASAVEVADRRHLYGKAALRGYWSFLFANLDVAVDRDGGSAWQATLQSRLGAVGLHVQHAQLDDFVSERFLTALSPLRSRSILRLDTAIPETWLPRVPLLLEARQDRLESGQRIDQMSARFSAFRRGIAVSNQLSWLASSGGGLPSRAVGSGQLLVSKFLQEFSIRGAVDYVFASNVGAHREVTSLALTGERRFRGLLVLGGVSQMLVTGETRLLAGLSKLEGAFGFSVLADYTRAGGFGASALVSVSVGRDARDGGWHPQARPLAGSGAVSGRAFLDTNGNGSMDPGEPPIAGAGFLLNGSGSMARTDETGVAFLPNLSAYQDVDLTVATATLEDPFWKPAGEGVRIQPRPGKVAIVDLPVLVTGEITGTVYLEQRGTSREAGGVELILIDRRGQVVKKVRTAYDGFYDITEIVPGGYTLSVTAEHVVRLRVVAPSRDLTILADGTVLDGVDFVLASAPVLDPRGGTPATRTAARRSPRG